MTVTVTPLPDPVDFDRKWYKLVGRDNGTNVEFNGGIFACHVNGSILDSDGCPLTDSDWETIAVRNSIPSN